MIDVLAPLGLLAMAGFVVLLVVTARRQQASRRELFRQLAAAEGWEYLERGRDVVEPLARDFAGFGRFRSSSVGELSPEATVVGRTGQGRVLCFLHGTREYEGQGRQWTVCLVEARKPLCGPLRIQPRNVRRIREVGGDPSVSFDDSGFEAGFAVTAPDPGSARRCIGPGVRRFLLSEHPKLPFPVDVQIRDRRVAAYLARRNAIATNVSGLQALVRFTTGLVAALLDPGG
ncbi:MAG TPA: hypothetical protein VE173_13350 [Longimicrobiales bacterium]|nr:hypothetical protein [Longimicrobiales bacterium]